MLHEGSPEGVESPRDQQAASPLDQRALLAVRNLHTHFLSREEPIRALNGVTFEIGRYETVGLVGETGSGKSLSAASILGLVRPPGRVVAGRALFDGRDLIHMAEAERRSLRGGEIALVPQNAKAALNPLLRVGDQIRTVYKAHLGLSDAVLRDHMGNMLESVGFSDPGHVADSYPHELSGGMAQRVVLAIAMGTDPKLIIADEPTSGLDSTVQVKVLDLMQRLLGKTRGSALLITHHLGIVAQYCERVLVMHAGQIVESADVESFFARPMHPYGVGLLEALRVGTDTSGQGAILVEGTPPDLRELPSGCLYRLRCPLAADLCQRDEPPMLDVGSGHQSKCYRVTELIEHRK